MALTKKQDVPHNGYIVRVYEHIDIGNWAYTIYEVTSAYGEQKQKWKRKRAMEHYLTSNAAEKAAKNFIDKHLK